MNEVDIIRSDRIERKELSKSIYTDLQRYVAQLLARKLGSLDSTAEDLLETLKKRQDRVRFMHDFLRDVNNASKGQGDIKDIDKNPKLKEYIEKAKEFEKAANELDRQAELLEKAGDELIEQGKRMGRPELITEGQNKKAAGQKLRQEGTELRDMAKTIKLLVNEKGEVKKTLSKEERARLVENINTVVDDFNTINQMEFHKINQTNQDRQTTIMMAKQLIKQLGDIIQSMGRAIRGG